MCGFVCFINEIEISKNYLNLLKKKQIFTHRGPDSQKYYIDRNFSAYFQRLSIIDLSKNSNQPLLSENKRYVMVFNGEIYNFQELRNKLKNKNFEFKSTGDAEVLLKYFCAFGEKFIQDIRGMFSFCIWDKYKKKLIAYRDRFGQKPLYFLKTNKGLILSSEIKDIKKVISLSGNNDAIKKYLYRNILDVKNDTFFKDLKRLGPSEKLSFHKNSLEINKYYNLDLIDSKNYDKEEFLQIFKETLKIHLISDVKIACLLSGGLDSSTIVANSIEYQKNLKAFSIFPKKTFDERPWIDDFVKKKEINHEYIDIENKINPEGFEKVLYYQDEPFHGTNCIYQFFLAQEIKKQNYKVVLNGEGADEVMGGYDRMFMSYMSYLFLNGKMEKFKEIVHSRNLNLKIFISKIKAMLKRIENKSTDFENSLAFNFLNKSKSKELMKLYNLKWNNITNLKGNIFKKTLKNSIYSNDLQLALRMSDRNSMSASIENRTPYLDHKFVEYIFSIKTENFYYNNLPKGMLRNSMNRINTKKITKRINKSGRPGSDSHFIYNKVFDDFIDKIKSSNIDAYGFDKKKIYKNLIKNYQDLKQFSLNKDIGNNNNFYFRLYSYLVWEKLN